jgi:putative transposase
VVGLSRSAARYEKSRRPEENGLRRKIRELARRHPRFGCRRIWATLRREGVKVNKKRVHRIWKAEGLGLPRKRPRRRRAGPRGEVIRRAQHPNHVWSYDFIEDRTERGGRLKMLTVLDEFTRRSLAIRVKRRIDSLRVIQTLEGLFAEHGAPGHVRSDNGPEFVAKAVREWLEQRGTQTIYITPGSPWENPYTESFHDKLRGECLNREVFRNGREAQMIVEGWRKYYNAERPHSALGYQTPEEFAAAWQGSVARATPSLPPPATKPALTGQPSNSTWT